MKSVILFFLLCVMCAINEVRPDNASLQQKMMGYVGKCKKETNLPADDFNKLMKREVPSSPIGKCFLFCLHKKIGVQDESGKKDDATLKKLLEEAKISSPKLGEKIEQIANRCWPELDENEEPCEGAYKTFQCYLKVAAEVNLSLSES